jgi:A/G-specific adenine glycosylase
MKNPTFIHLEKVNVISFQDDLINWFSNEMRVLPWRLDQDPYKVWVSEIMLQQTRVDTVIPYFNRFVEKFPTIKTLAEADEEEVLKAWEGLGYYSRVRNLQSAVQEVHENYDGIVPNNPVEISRLKGVGPYTAGAVLSIAYGLPEPAVDGNVMRVLSRILSIWEDIAKPTTRKIFEEVVRVLISHQNPSYFNQALMELGALICTPTSPSCLLCPVREHCHAFSEGVQNKLPVKSKKKKARQVKLAAALLTNEKGQFIVHKRPSEGLLANLWEYPIIELGPHGTDREQLIKGLNLLYNIEIDLVGQLTEIQHVFSHLIWDIRVFKGIVINSSQEMKNLKVVNEAEMERLPFPVSHQKMWKALVEQKKI